MRKSILRNNSNSVSPSKQVPPYQNVEDLEKQWKHVKQIHNQFQNHLSSPSKQRFTSTQPRQPIMQNIIKLVPHYKINLEIENEEVVREKNQYMDSMMQKYGNIHKKQQNSQGRQGG